MKATPSVIEFCYLFNYLFLIQKCLLLSAPSFLAPGITLWGCTPARPSRSVRTPLCWNTAHARFGGVINWLLSTNQPITPSTFIYRPLNHAVAGTSKGFHNQKRGQRAAATVRTRLQRCQENTAHTFNDFEGFVFKSIFKTVSLRTCPDLLTARGGDSPLIVVNDAAPEHTFPQPCTALMLIEWALLKVWNVLGHGTDYPECAPRSDKMKNWLTLLLKWRQQAKKQK